MSTSYSPVQKLLHWSVFLLVAGLYLITYGEEFYPRGDPGRDMIWWLHISFGLLLVAVVGLRMVWRLVQGAPEVPADMTAVEKLLAKVVHGVLYALLIVLPLLGVLLTWYRGDALSFFGLFTIGSPVVPDRDTAHFVKELHELAANAILIVAGVHAAAALWHHFVRRDDVLRRMLPN